MGAKIEMKTEEEDKTVINVFFLVNGKSYFDKVVWGGVSDVLPQHDTKCSDKALSGVGVGCEVL